MLAWIKAGGLHKSDAEKNYLNHEQELLAIIHALKEWRHWLLGGCYVVHSDNRSLVWLRTQPTLSRRQARWLRMLEEFDVRIEYVKGEQNGAADALSRHPDFGANPCHVDMAPTSTSPRQKCLKKCKKMSMGILVDSGAIWHGYRLWRANRIVVPPSQVKSVFAQCHRLCGHWVVK